MTAHRLSNEVLGRVVSGGATVRLRGAAVVALLLFPWPVFAQDILQSLGRSDSIGGTGTQNAANLPYTIRSGDFRLLVSPSLDMDWNDNINGATSSAQQDFILQPTLQLTGSYPLTERNVLTLSAGIGYAEYVEHPIYNGLRINEGSQLAFDVFVKDFRFNFHDLAQDSQDTGSQGGVAGTAFYGGLNNDFGLSVIWNLHDLILSLGFDHNNYIASSSLFEYLNYASENPLARALFKFRPNLTAGIEASAAFTSYSEAVLNNSQEYSAGLDANWKPDSFFDINARVGYAIYDYAQSSQSADIFIESPTGGVVVAPAGAPIRTANQSSWYAAVTISHKITERINYNLVLDNEIAPGVQSDASQVTSASLSANWFITKAMSLSSSLSYQHGQQGLGNVSGNLSETYDFVNGSVSLAYRITTALNLRLAYRRAQRLSSMTAGGYGQDDVSLNLTYSFL